MPAEAGTVALSPPTANVGYLPQERERRPGETVRDFLARRTGVGAGAARRWTPPPRRLAEGRPGADDAYATALERWLDLGGADLDERAAQVAAELGLAVDLDQPMTALSGGQAARAGHGVAAAQPLRRLPARRAHQRPRPGRPGAGWSEFVTGLRAGTVLVSHDREFLARTVTKVLELDLAQQQVNLYGGGYAAYLEERERARRHAREEYEEYAETKDDLLERARTQRAWMEKGVRNARRKATDPDKHVKHFRGETQREAGGQGPPDRAADRAAGGGRGAAQGVGAADGDRRRAPGRRGGGHPARTRWCAAATFTLGPGHAADRLGRPGRDHRRQRLRQVDAAGARCSAGSRWTRARASLGPGVVVGEVDQARGLFARRRAADRRVRRGGAGARRRRRSAPCWRSSGCGPTTCCARPAPCRRASAPGPRWRCCRPAGSTCWCWTSRRTTSTWPRSSSSSRRWPATTGTLLLVTHDRRMLDAVHTTRHLEVADGKVTGVDRRQRRAQRGPRCRSGPVRSGSRSPGAGRGRPSRRSRPVATSVAGRAVDAVERPADRLLLAPACQSNSTAGPAGGRPTSRGARRRVGRQLGHHRQQGRGGVVGVAVAADRAEPVGPDLLGAEVDAAAAPRTCR